MPARKTNKTVEKRAVTINIRIEPYFAARSDDPKLAGLTGVGPTPEQAITSLRSVIAHTYPFAQYEVTERIISATD